jgi:hypothetical protein
MIGIKQARKRKDEKKREINKEGQKEGIVY